MPTVEVNISQDAYEFVDEQNLDLDNLLEHAIGTEQSKYEYRNPTPELPIEITRQVKSVLESVDDEGQRKAFQDLFIGRVSISAVPRDDIIEIQVYSSCANKLPIDSIEDTLRESDEFLAKIGQQLRAAISTSTSYTEDEIEFELTERSPAEHEIDQDIFRYIASIQIN